MDWIRKRNIEKIPDLLEKIDKMTLDYIDNFNTSLSQEDWANMLAEYGVLIGMDFSRFKDSLLSGNKSVIDQESDRFSKAYNKKLNPQSKTEDSLASLRDMGGLLNSYHVGLENLTKTPQYHKLFTRIQSLQRTQVALNISVNVLEFFLRSEGLYCLLLSIKPIMEQSHINVMPTKLNAKKSQIRPVIEGQISVLISSVRESIVKYKDRNKSQPQDKLGQDKKK